MLCSGLSKVWRRQQTQADSAFWRGCSARSVSAVRAHTAQAAETNTRSSSGTHRSPTALRMLRVAGFKDG